jgi:hypothetical protein
MSTISSASPTTNPYQTANQSSLSQFLQDFNALGNALQSGTVATAQNALATFQQELSGNSQTPANQPFGNNSRANTDYQNLVSALKTGDLTTARQAFGSLKTDLKGTQKGHHNHHASGGVTPSTTPTTPATATASTTGATPSSGVDKDGDNDVSNLNVTA